MKKVIFLCLVLVMFVCFAFSSGQGVKYYPRHTVVDQGSTTGRSVRNFVDAIGSSKKATIVLSHSSNSNETSYLFETNETVPSNITLEIEPGAYIDGNATLTINSPFEAGLTKCFGSSITIIYGTEVNNILPEWRGADPTNAVDSSSEISKTIADADGKTVLCMGQYDVSTLKNYELTNDIVLVGVDGAKFDGKDAANSSIRVGGNISKILIKNLLFEDFAAAVISSSDPNYIVSEFTFENNKVESSNQGIYLRCVVQNAIVRGNRFHNLSATGACNGVQLGWNNYDDQDNMKKYIITDNEFYNLDSSGNGEEVHAILCYGREAVITNNVIANITNSGDGNGSEGIYNKTRYYVISNNTLIDAGTEEGFINIKGSNRDQVISPQGYTNIVSNNILINTSANTYHGIYIQNNDSQVINNTLEGFTGYAIYTSTDTIYDDIQIKGNSIIDHKGDVAIYLPHSGKRTEVIGNKINGLYSDSGTSDAFMIQAYINYGDCSNYVIDNNFLYDANNCQSTSSVRGIYVYVGNNKTLNDLSVRNNKIYTWNTGINDFGISLSVASGSTLSNCIVTSNDCSGMIQNSSNEGLYLNFTGTVTTCLIENNIGCNESVSWTPKTLNFWGYTELDTSIYDIVGTLPDAYYIGQTKMITLTDATEAADGGTTVSVTHHETSDPEVCTFDAVDEYWILTWTGTEWVTIKNTCTL